MSFHKALSDSLFNQPTPVKLAVLSGLHERGALDLDAVDEHGCTLLGHMAERQPLPVELVDFLDGIGRSDVYASAREGAFPLLDRHVYWLGQQPNAKTDETLARMIERVDAQWWLGIDQPGEDPGSRKVVALSQFKYSSLSLSALWRRGVAVDARLGSDDRRLAASFLNKADAFRVYMETGADICLPERLGPGSQPMWRVVLHGTDDIKPLVEEAVRAGRIDPIEGQRDLYLKELRLQRGNKADMIKHLFSRDDWQGIQTHQGTPAWLYAVSQRADILEELINRKRKRPDFSQRDHLGRSAWFWALARDAIILPKGLDFVEAMSGEMPPMQYLQDLYGNGIMTQIAKHAMTIGKAPTSLPSMLDMLQKQSDEVLFAGLDTVDFTPALHRTHNGGSDAQCPPVMGLVLLCNPRANAWLTAEQRGQIVATTLLNDTYMGSQYKDMWLKLMDKQPDMLEPIIWPEPDAQRLKLRSSNEFNGGQPLLSLSKALRQRWTVDWQAQELTRHTTQSMGQRARGRL